MKVMTFNLRNAIADDGANSWRFRRDFAVEYMLGSDADIICMQEVVPAVKADLAAALGSVYATVGKGRLAEKRDDDEINLVAYRKSAFTQSYAEHFWLSPTPDVAGSRYPTQIHWPRTCTHVDLQAQDGTVYRVYATHLDNADPIARERGLKLILDRAGSDRVLVCGDMNDVPENVHAWVDGRLLDLTDGLLYTYNGFGAERSKIDYILASRDIRPLSACVCKPELRGDLYISDHFPVIVELE